METQPAMEPATPHTPLTGEDGLDTRSLFFAAIVGMICVVIVILGAEVLYRVAQAGEVQRKVTERGTPETEATIAEQRARLEGYRWLDRAQGVVGVPIERAMELVAKERAERASAPGAGLGR